MENKESTEETSRKISHLNETLEDLVSDASELISDLYGGVRNCARAMRDSLKFSYHV